MHPSRRFGLFGAVTVAAVLGVSGDAKAVVVQINGQICPQYPDPTHCLVQGLNIGENGCPVAGAYPGCWANTATPPNNGPGTAGPQGPIDPVLDAALDPQVFAVPKTGANFNSVEFLFLYRGNAGFRNSFGWYNVGDDLSNLTNLHPVISCANTTDPPASTGTAAGNGNWDVTVNFQTELAAGRYKGGFIGFFLVTPEGEAGPNCGVGNSTNCGRADAGANCVGRIYYTERAINGDGNYVHYLVYQSKVLDAQLKRRNDYYFGFEDLYRGGDNDFKDVTMLVKGLVVPCSPQPEVCDGVDNNCDGVIDNNTTDTGPTTMCSTMGNPLVGACKAGHYVCENTSGQDVSLPGNVPGPGDTKVCVGEVLPTTEVCNGLDDDCNNVVDNPPAMGWGSTPAGMSVCPPSASLGVCAGTVQCEGAQGLQCVDAVAPSPETCNGLDDNCNGQIDENPTDVGGTCGAHPMDWGVGVCKPGHYECVNSMGQDTSKPGVMGDATDMKECIGEVGPSPEICDGLDNDCNGMVDDDPTDLSSTCSPQGIMSCGGGHEICVNGTKVCVGFTLPSPETCNGKDDNCNGKLDDMPVDVGEPCGTMCTAKHGIGACAAGLTVCEDSMDKDITMGGTADMGDHLACVGEVCPTPEVCDGKDNDCDGMVDDPPSGMMLPGTGGACTTMCGSGTLVCKDGNIVCQGANGGSVEYCDGKDDNCNGIIDDMPVDVGGACGTVFINDKVCQATTCAPGKNECVNSKGQDTSQPGVMGDTGDKKECVGEVKGSTETCNGVDDDCNGIVDDGVPGTGDDCVPNGPDGKPPVGVTVAMLKNGICQPGKTQCAVETTCADSAKVECKNGTKVCPASIACTGGVLPKAKTCSLMDNDCEGSPDTDGACPNPAQKCSPMGTCSSPCKGGEFPCPGGQSCVAGFCIENSVSTGGSGGASGHSGNGGSNPAGGMTGAGGAAAGGSSGHAGANAGGTSAGGASQGGANAGGATANTGGANGGAVAAGGSTTTQTGGANGETTDENRYGLATGGGGFACSIGNERSLGSFGALALALTGLLARRRRRNESERAEKEVLL